MVCKSLVVTCEWAWVSKPVSYLVIFYATYMFCVDNPLGQTQVLKVQLLRICYVFCRSAKFSESQRVCCWVNVFWLAPFRRTAIGVLAHFDAQLGYSTNIFQVNTV